MTATIHIDAGDAAGTDPFPAAVWDASTWDSETEFWAGSLPSWAEISCRVLEVECYRGRAGILDVAGPGTATVRIENDDGTASWRPDAPALLRAGSWLRIRVIDDTAGEQILWTGQVRRIVDRYTPGAALTADVIAVDPLARLGAVDLPARPAVGAGDTAAQRIARIAAEAFWPAEMLDLEAGGPTLTAVTLAGRLLDHAQRAAVAAGGSFFAGRAGTLTYRGADWLRTDPRATTPQAIVATDGRPGALCATAMTPNGPDLDRVVNVVSVSGIDAGAAAPTPVEVLEVDGASVQQYGAASLPGPIAELPTVDPAQLETIGRRVLGLRAQPTARVDTLELSPISDPDAGPYCARADLGDRIEVHYTHPVEGWAWALDCHVHAVRHRIRPAGLDQRAGAWACELTLDDASFWAAADVWDYGRWDEALWAGPQLSREV